MRDIIVMNGIHSAGKSTLAQNLCERRKEFAYFQEIGGQLRTEVSYNALQSGDAFDREVMRRELMRDKSLLLSWQTPVVETWHIGNISYAETRSPAVANEYRRELEKSLEVFNPTVILVEIGWDTFASRASENIGPREMPILVDFYRNIWERSLDLYKEYGIPHHTVRNEGTIETGIAHIEGILPSAIMKEGVIRAKEF